MDQLNIPLLEADVLASSLRREKRLLEELITEIQKSTVTMQQADASVRKIQDRLKRLCVA
jgi:hypothetical protein